MVWYGSVCYVCMYVCMCVYIYMCVCPLVIKRSNGKILINEDLNGKIV